MESREFALENTGRRVRVMNNGSDVPARESNPIGRIIGWAKDYKQTIVEFEDCDDIAGSWAIPNSQNDEIFDKNATTGWRVYQHKLIFLEEIKQSKLYRNTCRYCGSPSRNNKNYVLCSNVRCKKSRRTIKHFKCTPVITAITKNYFGYYICPTCGAQASNTAATTWDAYDASGGCNFECRFTCDDGHNWLDILVDGAKLSFHYSGRIVIWSKNKNSLGQECYGWY